MSEKRGTIKAKLRRVVRECKYCEAKPGDDFLYVDVDTEPGKELFECCDFYNCLRRTHKQLCASKAEVARLKAEVADLQWKLNPKLDEMDHVES